MENKKANSTNFRGSNSTNKRNILTEKTANEWLEIGSKIKDPKSLFGNIWHQGEVGILFSNTGKGKSILAVQIADAITKGNPILGENTEKYKVLYFDFELSTKSFQKRYSESNTELYSFNPNFLRIEIDRSKNSEDEKLSFEQLIIDSITIQALKNKAEVLIIDNITYLSASNEKSHEALELMKIILKLSREYNISILLIAHTPKRDIYSPIQLEDLAGSKALSNFVDICFCIGESVKGDTIRYIKQLKNRNYSIEYGQENVINCEIIKKDSFLKFEMIGFGTEKEHLQIVKDNKKTSEAFELKNSGKTNVEIAKLMGVNEKTIRRWLKKIENGQ